METVTDKPKVGTIDETKLAPEPTDEELNQQHLICSVCAARINGLLKITLCGIPCQSGGRITTAVIQDPKYCDKCRTAWGPHLQSNHRIGYGG